MAALDGRSALFGRDEIADRDQTLPMALALFDQRRYAESLTWFHKAFDTLPLPHGGDEAALFLGKLYLDGPGNDPAEGVRWLKRAATAAFNPVLETPIFDPLQPDMNTAIGEAAVILGTMYRYGYKGVAKDPAQVAIGTYFYEGQQLERNFTIARKWFEAAARGNDPDGWSIWQR